MNDNNENMADGNDKTFAGVLQDLLDGINSPLNRKVSQKELAEKIGVSRQAISQYCKGVTSPNAETLKNIAEYFDVSSDYLIGLSTVITNDIEAKTINKKIGLSENAINTLKKINEQSTLKDDINHSRMIESINYILGNKQAEDFLFQLSVYLYCDLEIKREIGREYINDEALYINLIDRYTRQTVNLRADTTTVSLLHLVSNQLQKWREEIQKEKKENQPPEDIVFF